MSQESEKLAVAVVLYESAGLLPELVASIRAQTRPIDRIVFCLNGEDDGAATQLSELLPEAIVIGRPDNPGFAGGMNACLAAVSDCPRVFMLNPDVVLEPDHLARLDQLLDEEPRAAGAAGLLLGAPDTEGRGHIDSTGFVTQPWLRIVDRAAGCRDAAAFSERESVLGICAAAALFRTRALLDAAEDGQVLDEDFWMYKEDQDLCLRLRAAGWRLFFEPSARAHHARGWSYGGRGRVALELRRHSLKNRYLLLIKHWRWPAQAWTLPFICTFELAVFVALSLREPRTLKGYLMALRLLPRALGKRRALLARKLDPLESPEPAWLVSQ